MTISAACESAGLSQSGWFKAFQRPAVRDHLKEVQAEFVSEAEGLRATAQVAAIEAALDLMKNAKSETVRARMAEFLAAGAKADTGVNVAVQVNNTGGGYEYVRPGQKLVEVKKRKSDPKKEQ
ncbi:hypothetical protein [Pseudoruegeria sp. SHC-113]|uniref:hypothetical protein n=1 Tax=Pseudoruegeria sp. SHC-113 TaxID=2855439 RepID=UPI0021BADBE0|nr:hypothetical protein [Pseudoruegeria sp. SHC-113]MCT8160035.1 hypothetical protein [Pseudoruegeria sp. SHC-113]